VNRFYSWHAALLLFAVSLPWPPGSAFAAGEESPFLAYIEADEFEYRAGDGDGAFAWDVQGWAGGDYNKVWFKTRGDAPFEGSLTHAEVQILYNRAASAFWDLQAGLRYDVEPDPARGFTVLGIQGLAPYFFEIDAAVFASHEGELSARLEVEYELLLTQRLIAEPSGELNFAFQEVGERGIGSGLSEMEFGVRLRYEILREFAPYAGVSWERSVGGTADIARSRGEGIEETAFVAGVRFWY
jgi:copper resistance protein B